MKCSEEIFSGSIDCNWRNVSAEGLIAQSELEKYTRKFLKNALEKVEHILEMEMEMCFTKEKYFLHICPPT